MPKREPSKSEIAQRWEEFTREVIAQTDIEAAYRRMGVEIVGAKPNSTGWVRVRAVNRQDAHPSAAINVGDDGRRGRYRDLGGDSDSLSLFDFAVKYGNLGLKDRHDARMFFANEAGLSRRAPKTKSEELADSIRFLPHLAIERQIGGFLARYPGITAEGVKLCGGVIGKWPANSPEPNYCLILPAYGIELLDAEPRGYTLMLASGGMIRVFSGEGVPPREEKRINRGPSGLVGKWGLRHLDEAEVVWKVEGISDLLCLQSIIPESLRKTHVVVTNNSGASEISLPSEVAHLFATKTVCILHDCDTPGQDGAAVWVNAMANANCTVKNITLPYEITENHGKDLRDWVADGATYQQLLELAGKTEPAATAKIPKDATTAKVSTPVETSVVGKESHGSTDNSHGHAEYADDNSQFDRFQQPQAGMTAHQAVLKRIGLQVLGELSGSSKVICHSNVLHKTFDISDIARFKYEHMLQQVGPHCEDIVILGPNVGANQVHFHAVTRAIAVEGGKRTVSSLSPFGQGVWNLGDRLILVNHREAAVLNGCFAMTNSPCIDGRLVDHTSGEKWFDYAELEDLYGKSASTDWCREQFAEAVALFSRWNNWTYSDTPELVAALSICSWLQTVWEWRPMVAVTGATATGKTTLLERTLPFMFGKLAMPLSKPSDSGLRQLIGSSARVVTIDEFEEDKHRQNVMEMLRTSGSGTMIARGTANQKGVLFGLKHIVWCGAIELGLKKQADRNRLILLELEKLKSGPRMELPPTDYLAKLGQRLLAVALRYWRECRGMARELCRMPYQGVDVRSAECYGLPMAMIAAIMGEGVDAARQRMLDVFDLRGMISSEASESDEEDLLLMILGSLVEIGSGRRMTVSELLTADESNTNTTIPVDRDEILQRNGVKPCSDGTIFLWKSSLSRKILRDTPYANQDINQILRRINGAKQVVRRMLGANAKGVVIPVESIRHLIPKVGPVQGIVPGLDFDGEDEWRPERSKTGDTLADVDAI